MNPKLSKASTRRIDVVQSAAPDAEKSTLAQTVYERIKDDLFEFRMAPGQRYSEQELATGLGVSRTPLRFALHVLAREGYLVHVEGHAGWMVKPFDLAYYEDLYDFRVQIELIAVRRLCAMDPAPDLSEPCAFWCVPKRQRNLDGPTVSREDEKLHSTLVALAGSTEMLRVHTDLTERVRIIRRLDFVEPARIKSAYDEHERILRALLARKVGEAEMLIRAHIASSRAEIRHITLHRLALASMQGREAKRA
jgi:DNA-binding GntR family transcriptional regulator